MASKQVALARPNRPPVQHVQPQVQRIPAFLNKLYEMVNDTKTNHLIKWADLGDSFYVYDQEHFARDVLPHWFKHQNFASFVRQLNMYGFHKIPHLQQGVLKSEAGSEHWNFVHPNFRRDQPDLLCYIQRKKSTTAAEDERESAALPTANAQVLDIHGIVSGIAAIQRHQTTISTELSDLKRNNELLWQETQAARARHQKQQDTINRIVKFLAGVFASHGSPVHKEDVGASTPSRAVVPRRQTRLMIEGGVMDPGRVDEADSPAQFASIETPSAASPMEPVSPNLTSAPSESPALPPISLPPPAPPSSNHVVSTQPQHPQTPSKEDLSITPSRSPTNADFDNLIQGALSSLTPAQIQQLMNSISMPNIPEFPGSGAELPENMDSSLTSYQPLNFDSFSASFPLIPSPPQSASLLDKVDTSWRSTEDIEQDVEAVDSKINNLFNQLQIPTADGSSLPLNSSNGSHQIMENSNPSQIDSDLFHSFLNGIGNDDEGVLDGQNDPETGFLDEVSASDGTLSPVNTLQNEQPTAQKSGKKRKSDVVAGSSDQDSSSSPGTRAKRRRDR